MIADPTDRVEATSIPTGLTVRVLEEEELPHVSHTYWRTYLDTPNEMSLPEATKDILASWNGEYGRWLADACLGAWRDDELIGAVLTVLDPPWPDVPPGAFIIDLFVLPSARRRGAGRALVTAVQHNLKTSIALRVDESAREARALYESLGFREST